MASSAHEANGKTEANSGQSVMRGEIRQIVLERIQREIVPLCRAQDGALRPPPRIVLGLNAVTRALEREEKKKRKGLKRKRDAANTDADGAAACARGDLQVIIVCRDNRSPTLGQHLSELARLGGIPCCILATPASQLGGYFGCRHVAALAIAHRAPADAETDSSRGASGTDAMSSIAAFLAQKATALAAT